METLSYCQLMERCLAAEARVVELESHADAEPYGYVHKGVYEQCGSSGLSNDHEAFRDSQTHIPLYTRPQRVPIVPDEIEPTYEVLYDEYYCDGWNACRTAMLQGTK